MLTIAFLLGVAAFIVTIAHAVNRAPLWVAVLLLCLIQLLQWVPVR